MFSKKGLLSALGVLVLVVSLGFAWIVTNDGYKVSITNNTDSVIKDLVLAYVTNDSPIETISEISPNETWSYRVDTGVIQSEDVILLHYTTDTGAAQTVTVVGYLTRGENGNVKLSIKGINGDGTLDVTVQEK